LTEPGWAEQVQKEFFLIEKNIFTAFFKRKGYLHFVGFIPTLLEILDLRLVERRLIVETRGRRAIAD